MTCLTRLVFPTDRLSLLAISGQEEFPGRIFYVVIAPDKSPSRRFSTCVELVRPFAPLLSAEHSQVEFERLWLAKSDLRKIRVRGIQQ